MPFWSNSPAAWFRAGETQFVIHGVTDPLDKFYVVLTALSKSNVDRVRHIVEAEPDQHSYQNLKDGLVASHVMSDYQKIDKLVSMELLNGRKPSDLLAEMEKLKPSDEQQHFAYHFLQRLPREVRVLLTREPINNTRALAEKADSYMALHQPQSHVDVTAVATSASILRGQNGRRSQRHQQEEQPGEEEEVPLAAAQLGAAGREEITPLLAAYQIRRQSQAVRAVVRLGPPGRSGRCAPQHTIFCQRLRFF
jgi:hypothetical protein